MNKIRHIKSVVGLQLNKFKGSKICHKTYCNKICPGKKHKSVTIRTLLRIKNHLKLGLTSTSHLKVGNLTYYNTKYILSQFFFQISQIC